MTDEPRPDQPGTETTEPAANPGEAMAAANPAEAAAPADTAGAVATASPPEAEEADKPAKLHQQVEIRDVGPCKKHIKVTVDREDIDAHLSEKFSELMVDANVAGFRPGKAPRKIIERRFQKEVGDKVKTEVLLASLEQLGEDYDLAPLSPPNLDPADVHMPNQGSLVYEFEVEVRPEFELPDYTGLRLKRPVHTFTEEEVAQEERRLLAPYGQVVPKPEGNAEIGDVLVADVTTRDGQRVLSSVKEVSLSVNKQLAFKDGVADRFGEQVRGASAGDSRAVDVTVSSAAADPALRGKTVQATFEVKEVKKVLPPELTHEFLHTFGVHSPDQLRELIRVVLERRLEHAQRQSARRQVIEQISAAASWELPRDLLAHQARKAMARRVMEMRADGISEEEIAGRQRLLEQDILRSTALALQEHFVLEKIAEVEKIDVSEEDLHDEIERLADQKNVSPRRLRAQLEKEDLLDTLAAEMIERKALDLILDSAVYEDVPLGQEDQPAVSTVETQAIPGEMQDPAAVSEPTSEPADGGANPPREQAGGEQPGGVAPEQAPAGAAPQQPGEPGA